jgi:hypothetical protein
MAQGFNILNPNRSQPNETNHPQLRLANLRLYETARLPQGLLAAA